MKRRRWREGMLLAVAPRLAHWVILALARWIRPEVIGEEHPRTFWERDERIILSFWHDQLLLMVAGYRGPGTRILISSSKDGELIARTMERFGQGAVRGSSRRGGRAAFRELVELGRQPFDLAITPDGPKGPRHELKEGVVQLARLTGRPVIPLAFACSRGHRFASWDRFLFPSPFAKGVFSYGSPLSFAQGEKPEDFHRRLQGAMEDNCRRAAEHLERFGVSAV